MNKVEEDIRLLKPICEINWKKGDHFSGAIDLNILDVELKLKFFAIDSKRNRGDVYCKMF